MKPIGSNGEERRRPVILTFTAFYVPGYKGGGPIRSIANMVKSLSDEFDFHIVTSDRDWGDLKPYPGIRVNEWQEVAGARILYLSPGPLRWWRIARLLFTEDCDLIYLNSFFSRAYSILPIWLRRLGAAWQIPILLAPRGEFSPGALEIKAFRKRCYLTLQKFLWLYKDVGWHASTECEKIDVLNTIIGTNRITIAKPILNIRILIASDLAGASSLAPSNTSVPSRTKIPGKLNLVFISRISRKKNLDGALKILAGVRGEVHFNIYGPIEDANYWAECQRLINTLPANVLVDYRGELPHAQTTEVFQIHHLFFFPTRGENFGHVIAEALLEGCPVLISDQTPWLKLQEKGAGWDLPLDRTDLFQQAIEECVAMDELTFQRRSQQARLFGSQKTNSPEALAHNRSMFERII